MISLILDKFSTEGLSKVSPLCIFKRLGLDCVERITLVIVLRHPVLYKFEHGICAEHAEWFQKR